MEELDDILEQATASIARDYFYLNLDGGDPVYRERVYCYELYHQLRLRWPAETPFYLNGEVDTEALPLISDSSGVGYREIFRARLQPLLGRKQTVGDIQGKGDRRLMRTG